MRRLLTVLIPLLLASQTARAGGRDNRERSARLACLSGDYAKGVAILAELFIDTKDPNFLYNQGRCFEQNLRYVEAIGRFQEYLRAGKKLSKDEQADAEKHIADCKGLLAAQSQPVVAAPVVVAPPPAAPTVVAAAPPPMVQQSGPQPAGESRTGLRTAGIITAAFGGAAVVAGVILNLKVNSMASDMQKTNGYTDSKDSDRKTYESLGWAGYGVGAACVVTGAVLYYLGARSGSTGTSSVAFVPTLAPGQAGAIVKGAF